MDIIEIINYGRMICYMRIQDVASIIRPVYDVGELALKLF